MTLRLRIEEGVEFRCQSQQLPAHLAAPVIGRYRELLHPVEDLVHSREVIGHGCERNEMTATAGQTPLFLSDKRPAHPLLGSPPGVECSTGRTCQLRFFLCDPPRQTPAVVFTYGDHGGSVADLKGTR